MGRRTNIYYLVVYLHGMKPFSWVIHSWLDMMLIESNNFNVVIQSHSPINNVQGVLIYKQLVFHASTFEVFELLRIK